MPEDLSPSAGKIRVKITSPLSPVVDLEADSVEIPTPGGRRLMMPKTAPLFCLVKAGKIIIHQENKSPVMYRVSSGVCEVRRGICAIMAWAEEKTSIRPDKIRAELARGEKVLATLPVGKASEAIQNRLDFYRFILGKTGG